MRALVFIAALISLGAAGCGGEATPLETTAASAPSSSDHAAPEEAVRAASERAPLQHPPERDATPGDPLRGRELVAHFECARCHEGTGVPAIPTSKHCVRCHQEVHAGKLGGGSPDAARFREHVAHLRDVPSLADAGKRLRRAWIERYLLDPHDLRPALTMTMPRLAITKAEARDIATYLVPEEAPGDDAAALAGADMERGRALVEVSGCGSCHAFRGAPPIGGTPSASSKEDRSVVALAPDLRHARDRLRPSALVAWLLDPKALKPDAVMPRVPLSAEQARDIAAYLLQAPLASTDVEKAPERLPLLSRRVTYKEVEERVFSVTCRHCHSEPRTAIGDGGPGNGGGFGFRPRRLDLGSYRGIAAGFVDDQGERRSVFEPLPDGTPRLVAALIARHAEEARSPSPGLRGMPLGLPPLPLEDIQLVETWITQGRPQ